ncbi:MAG TPA: M1 family aminopeptidase [Pyrinomonadaceae bacterium]|nr:M1 family aminopeptidase [Pyrinomonadaceae bacterium]
MKLLFLLIFPVILMMTNLIAAQTPPIETGVSQKLAQWRGKHYSDVKYKLNITLEKGAPLMKGDIEIRVNLTDEAAKTYLVLDWRTTQFENDKDKPFADVVSVNESVIKKLPETGEYAYSINKEHIVIAQRLLKTGENVIKIEFASPIKTSGAAITRYVDKEDNAEYIYSLFVPSDASTAFPVFDQPDLKARFMLTTRVPWQWRTISNSNIRGGCFAVDQGAPITCRFEETKPISTYVFAFAAGEFAEFEDKGNSAQAGAEQPFPTCKSDDVEWINSNFTKDKQEEIKPNTFAGQEGLLCTRSLASNPKIYVRKSQAEKFKQHSAEVFRLNREGVKYLESYFDYKFPFPKYDLVLIPEFPFGGMEHAGATFLRESSVIFPNEPTKNDYVSRANLIFHEAAHQWFGDTVTMKWFDDLWLKEGFAEFMAYKTLAQVMPEYNAWKIFYERNKQLAYLTDSTKGTTPIYQEITNLSSAKSAYGNIVYRKAPSFLKQAEFYLGEKEF